MSKKATWQVQLGPTEWARFTYSRPEGDPLQLLGSVRRGAQMGALALTSDGQYVQVVGDLMEPLSRSQIDKALAKARGNVGCRRPLQTGAPRATAAPVVIVKRRRLIGDIRKA